MGNLGSYFKGFSIIALAMLLGACAKQEGLDGNKSVFQAKAERYLLDIANKVSTGKAAARGGGNRGIAYYDPNQWVPNNNTFMMSDSRAEVEACRNNFRSQAQSAQPTRANYNLLVASLYQCLQNVLQARNGFATALYRSLGTGSSPSDPFQLTSPQMATQFGWSWRYPGQYPEYANIAGNYQQFQNQFGNSGYVPTTVQYTGNPTQYQNPWGYSNYQYQYSYQY